jgi:hypothetical protein
MKPPIISDDFLITSIYTTSHTDYDGNVCEFEEVLGIRLTGQTTTNTVTRKEIYLGGYSVVIDSLERQYLQLLIAPKLIPRWYCVRSNKKYRSNFVCGLDIVSEGYWVGLGEGQTFSIMQDALNFITSQIGSEFYICLEGEMQR